jgi:hypothetical protein
MAVNGITQTHLSQPEKLPTQAPQKVQSGALKATACNGAANEAQTARRMYLLRKRRPKTMPAGSSKAAGRMRTRRSARAPHVNLYA